MKKESNEDTYGFTELELKIIDDEIPPDFYPFEVIQLVKWIDRATKAVVIIVILFNLTRFPTWLSMLGAYSYEGQNSFLIYFVAFIAMTINALIGIAMANFILKTLSQILRILMEMEFNSRRARS
jgi:hypothetical protein